MKISKLHSNFESTLALDVFDVRYMAMKTAQLVIQMRMKQTDDDEATGNSDGNNDKWIIL